MGGGYASKTTTLALLFFYCLLLRYIWCTHERMGKHARATSVGYVVQYAFYYSLVLRSRRTQHHPDAETCNTEPVRASYSGSLFHADN